MYVSLSPIPRSLFLIHQGGTTMYHHSCILYDVLWVLRVWGDLFVTCWWWHRTSYGCSNDARPAFWLGTFFRRWMVWRLRPKRTAEIMVKKYPPTNSHRHTQINLYLYIYIHIHMSYLELGNIFKSPWKVIYLLPFQEDRKSFIVAGLTASRHVE